MSRSLVAVARSTGVVALSLVLAHQAVFLARYGSIYGEALVHSGHGAAWSGAVAVVVVGAGLLAAGALAGLYRLGRQVATRSSAKRAIAAGVVDAIELPRIGQRWLRMAIAIGATALILLTVQENVEHLAAGLGLPGVGILVSPEYPFAVLITLAASFAVAFVATLLSWRRDVLVRRLSALTAEPRREVPPTKAPDPVRLLRRRGSILARRLGRRAPPVLLAA